MKFLFGLLYLVFAIVILVQTARTEKKFLYKPFIVFLYYVFCTLITVFVAEKYYVFGLMGFLVIYGLNKIKVR